MFSIITKKEYFRYVDDGLASLDRPEIKNVQDGFILSRLGAVQGARILEIGGGDSRVLPRLHESNELWNADKLEGHGNGPTEAAANDRYRLVRTFIGDNHPELPDDYFDYVFSISVIEHIPSESLRSFINDLIRMLKPGGLSIHAIDLYVGDADQQDSEQILAQNNRVRRYRTMIDLRSDKVEWLEPPALSLPVIASSRFAANSNNTLYHWSRRSPHNRAFREEAQSVSLQWAFRKLGG